MSWSINIDVIIKGKDVNIKLIKDRMMITGQWWNIFTGKDNDIQITLKDIIIQWQAIIFTMTGYLLHYGFCYVTFGGHYNTMVGHYIPWEAIITPWVVSKRSCSYSNMGWSYNIM